MLKNETIEAIDAALRTWQRENAEQVPGLTVCVRDDDGVLLSGAYGIHDRATGQPLHPEPIFAAGSHSKMFTSFALQLLAEGEKIHPLTGRPLSLQDSITELLPHLKVEWLEGVTLADALAHRTRMSGHEVKPVTAAELRNLDKDAMQPVNLPRDRNYNYSNPMFCQLGVVVEDVLRVPENGCAERGIATYRDFVTEAIIKPHGLGEIYPGYDAIPAAERARIPAGNTPDSANTLRDLDAAVPTGGFFGTAKALSGFYHRLARGEILPGHAMSREGGTGVFAQLDTGIGSNLGVSWAGSGIMTYGSGSLDPEMAGRYGQNPYHVPGGHGRMAGHSGRIEGYASETWHTPHGLTVTVGGTGYREGGPALTPRAVTTILELAFHDIPLQPMRGPVTGARRDSGPGVC